MSIIHLRIEKSTLIRVLHDEPAFAELFTAYLLTRNLRIQADLVDQLCMIAARR